MGIEKGHGRLCSLHNLSVPLFVLRKKLSDKTYPITLLMSYRPAGLSYRYFAASMAPFPKIARE